MRFNAVESLGQLGRTDYLLALACIEHVDEEVRHEAAKALEQIGRPDEAAQAWLTLARDEQVDEGIRKEAIQALGKWAGPDVLPDLRKLTERDKDKDVRRAARQAIEQIRQRSSQ